MAAPIDYTIDKHNRILAVSDSWHQFYLQNGGTRPSGSFVGENLFQSIAGKDVQMLYGTLLRHVRWTQSSLSFPYCCNSDTVRRDMVMTIRPLADDGLSFSNTVMSTTPWKKCAEISKPKLPDALILCSWCNKIKADTWLEPQIAILRYGLFDSMDPMNFAHGICPRCQRNILSALTSSNSGKSIPSKEKSPMKCA